MEMLYVSFWSGPPGAEIKDGNKAVAMVTGLRAGRYMFKLSVQDEQGASDNAVMTVTIREGKKLSLLFVLYYFCVFNV